MNETKHEYDVFLSYANEDVKWCETLAERLREEGVRVWFDKWKLTTTRRSINQLKIGLKNSRKMIAVFSIHYLLDKDLLTLTESYFNKHKAIHHQERPLIPLLIDGCDIPLLFSDIHCIDFKIKDDFDLRCQQLIEEIDLLKMTIEPDDRYIVREPVIDYKKREKESYEKGRQFEDKVAILYKLLGFKVKPDNKINDVQIDLMIEKKEGGAHLQAIVECKNKPITSTERNQILAQQLVVKQNLPSFQHIAVSSKGFASGTRSTLEKMGISCITYSELLHELVPLDQYVEKLIFEYEDWITKNWNGQDWFIRPDIETDPEYKLKSAMTHIAGWLGNDRTNLLTILGDLGTGKSTLAGFLAYQLARSFRDDPLRHPAPVLIPLREVRKEVSLPGIIISHFDQRGIPQIDFPRFEHLVKLGKVILLFDAFDEMADRVKWEITTSNFSELNRAAEDKGKVLLTCRTHYFKDRNEQAKLIGEGPSLSEIETELYKDLKAKSGAEVIYLKEFDDSQIKTYLKKARPKNAIKDWEKIEKIYNLKDLAHRPLLLDMIVKTLPKLKEGQSINAANLYSVYTNIWIEREEKKHKIILDQKTKLALMLELAWRMWHDEKSAIHYKELTPFLEKLTSEKRIDFGDEELEDVANIMQTATFLKRDDKGNFSFVHKSFMEYFLSSKIHNCLKESKEKPKLDLLNTRRLDRKIVYFLHLLDTNTDIKLPLQNVLTNSYTPNISENALQILYWCGRMKADMEEKIDDPEKLSTELEAWIPEEIIMEQANLEEIVLECAPLRKARLSGSNLTKANLNRIKLNNSTLSETNLTGARIEKAYIHNSNFHKSDLSKASFTGSKLSQSDFSDTIQKDTILTSVEIDNCTGMISIEITPSKEIMHIVQYSPASKVYSISFSSKGNLLAIGQDNGQIIIFRITDGKMIRMLEGHNDCVNSVHFSPDGKLIASASDDKSIRIWNTNTGKIIRILEGHKHSVNSIDFSPDGKLIASASYDKTIYIWNINTGKIIRILEGHKHSVNSIDFSPDGKLIASASYDKTIYIWNTNTGKIIHMLEGHKHWVNSVHFSPDGKLIASASYDETIYIWNTNTGEIIHILEGHKRSVNSIDFSPDGKLIASASYDTSVRIWNTNTGRMIHILEGHKHWANSVHFSPDGTLIASVSDDKSVRVWNTNTKKLINILKGHNNSIFSVDFSSNGRRIASAGSDNSIRVWNANTGKLILLIEKHKHWTNSVHFSPNGDHIAAPSNNNTVYIWNVDSRKMIQILEGHKGSVRSVHFSPDGTLIASASDDNSVRVWDTDTGETIQILEGHKGSVRSVHFSSDGVFIASASDDKSIRVWNTKTGIIIRMLKGHNSSVRSVQFSPDSRFIASASNDHSVRIWNTNTYKCIRIFEGHNGSVYSVHFSPDNKLIASASYDQLICVWNPNTGNCLQRLKRNLGPVYSVQFSPNGKYLISAGEAGRLQYWDYKKGKIILYRYAFGPGAWLDLLPDGRFDASPAGMRYLGYTESGTNKYYSAEELVKEFYDPEGVRESVREYVE
jgi:WD40 repeat protein